MSNVAKFGIIIESDFDDMYLSPVEIEQLIYAEMQKRFPDRLKEFDIKTFNVDVGLSRLTGAWTKIGSTLLE